MIFGHPTPGVAIPESIAPSLGSVTLGSDLWIGEAVHIFSGVHTGHGAVIGARSLVTSDIPAYAIYAGQPARLIRSRFDDNTVASLLELKWWEFSDEVLSSVMDSFYTRDIETALRQL